MRRKALWLSVGLLLLVAGSVVATVVVLAKHEPAFYGRCAVPPGPERAELGKKFQTELARLLFDIRNGGNVETGNWRGNFSDAQINSYLQDEFLTSGAAEKLLPDGVTEPRMIFEKDHIRLAFRYGTWPWSTIISVDFRVWVAQKEPNVVILQLQGLHAGALPISAQSLLEELSESLRRQNIQVTWYRHEGNPTAALKFQTDQQRPTGQVQQVDLKTGTLTILGHSNDSVPRPPLAPREKI
jgi:hypothetical protein